MTEVWVDVVNTNGRYEISNFGNLRQVWKNERRGKKTNAYYVGGECKRIVSDFKTGILGWYVFFDGEKYFISREHAMKGFDGIPVQIDPKEEQKAVELAKKMYRPSFGKENHNNEHCAEFSAEADELPPGEPFLAS